MSDSGKRPCFFCNLRSTDKVYVVFEGEFLEDYRIAVGLPSQGPVGWAICDECGRLAPEIIADRIREYMILRAVSRYREGLPTVIEDDETLRRFEALAVELFRRNGRPATCREGWHRARANGRGREAEKPKKSPPV